ncbi:probable Na(+)/H(+) antiporter nhx-9 isoform X1 [Homarus americanus]|uniref:probable Na(+)/H(+) antiporter nhx-9 isoform X1 n=1 Tax=Homarus americanus TaxID=6706 RepID=UPI001C45B71B|nr:probable Na(+)/H(+) antiporter nhx-9 isoform X1 [Homarus americanus]
MPLIKSTRTVLVWVSVYSVLVLLVLGESLTAAKDNYGGDSDNTSDSTEATGKNSCHTVHHQEGIHLVSIRWQEVGVYYTITAFVIIAGFTKLAFHHLHWLSHRVPESCLLVVLGIILGVIFYFFTQDEVTENVCHTRIELPHFTSDKFFFVLLPPIVLESAYSLHDRSFFDNLGTVLVFAIVGTMFNIFAIGPSLYGLRAAGAMGDITFSFTEILVFSSLISAVDPVAVLAIFQELGVNKDLYFLIFGESLLNDGVTVVVYNTMQAFMSMTRVTLDQYALAIAAFLIVVCGGIAIGIIFGCLTALVTKSTTDVRVVEPLALLGLAYLSYLTAELFHFSGIISLIVCGLLQAHYAFANISQKSYTCVKYFTKMASATSDTVIFMFLGMVLVSDEHEWHTGFVLWSVTLCFIYRFIGVFVLTFLMNNYRVKKIGLEEQFIAAYGGLRGAVAFSLVNMLDKSLAPRRIFVTTTLIVILFTIFIQGMTIKPLVNLLQIQKHKSGKRNLSEEINTTTMDHIMAGVEEILGQHGDFYLRELMVYYNDKYLKKWFLRPSCESKLQRLFEKIAISEHYAHLYGPVALIEDKVTPLCPSVKRERKIRPSSFSMSHKDEILIEPRLNLEDEDGDVEIIPGFVHDGSVELRKKRGSILPTRRSRVASSSSEESTSHQQSHDAQVLRKAFRNNPYNKLHYKYNPNLVGEEDQELAEHLHRRHLNARRMTRLARSAREAPSARPPAYNSRATYHATHPMTDKNPEFVAPENTMDLPEGVVELMERHNTRRRTMSVTSPRTLQSCFSSPEPGHMSASPHILRSLQEAVEPTSSLPDVRCHDTLPSTAEPSPMGSPSAFSDPVRHVLAEKLDTKTPTSLNEGSKDGEDVPLVRCSPSDSSAQSAHTQHTDESV